MAKTNKSLKKRLTVTKRRKVLARKSGKGHFNAKQKRTKQLRGRKRQDFKIGEKDLGRFLPNSIRAIKV